MDVLNFGTEDTQVRYTFDSPECMLLMDACAALREARFPGILAKLPRMFDDEDLARVMGSEEAAADVMAIFEMEQAFHQALHMFPGGHDHGDHDHDGHGHDHGDDEHVHGVRRDDDE
jgi:hypothetical protein